MPRLATVLALLSLLAGSWLPPAADAQVRRCETADGRTVYTDRMCQDLAAVERLPRDGQDGRAGTASGHLGRCSRTLQDLTFELTMAIDGRDANRLAGIYHWPGIGNAGGYAIMDRLDAIAQRPLIDARPLFPTDAPVAPAPHAAVAGDMADTAPTDARDPAQPPSSGELMRRSQPWRPSTLAMRRSVATARDDALLPPAPTPVEAEPAPRRQAPYALQVDQTLSNGSTPSRTVFGLRRHLGCWWISF